MTGNIATFTKMTEEIRQLKAENARLKAAMTEAVRLHLLRKDTVR